MSQEKMYPRICLWCKKKGIYKIVGYSEIEDSHGMCEECKQEERERYYGKESTKWI